ncbi:hypothetical protein SAMN02949497_1683 [Methylomagnum ishizawai]|uniref:Uncharacterized protein n=1 Tax=Methylomagnum ishizawai TaxID=1760988 RepID=A0A1Y6CVD9_9GAMM|nr:hypothetical protein [Methylomagnum ishizawai]SMF94371.1 hypothetical protein SAMN02949497_1683 [Methylomagnum ishizawai]
MKFENEHGIAVELRIAGYEFPEINRPLFDDWLMIEGDIIHPKGNWRFRDPALTVGEATSLGNWLEGLPTVGKRSSWGAMEPVLHFKLKRSAGKPILQIGFGCESAPPWLPKGKWIYLDFALAKVDMPDILHSWRGYLQIFPSRAVKYLTYIEAEDKDLTPEDFDENGLSKSFIAWWEANRSRPNPAEPGTAPTQASGTASASP